MNKLERDWEEMTSPVKLFQLIDQRLTVRRLRLLLCHLHRFHRNRDRIPCLQEGLDRLERLADRRPYATDPKSPFPFLQSARRASVHSWVLSTLADDDVMQSSLYCQVLRDLVANPAAPPLLRHRGHLWEIVRRTQEKQTAVLHSDLVAWYRPLHLQMIESMYNSGAFEDAPILADALEEAGCSNQAVLGHLRGPGPHYLGCWVMDTLLGREKESPALVRWQTRTR